MKLQLKVDQGEALRQDVDVPTSVAIPKNSLKSRQPRAVLVRVGPGVDPRTLTEPGLATRHRRVGLLGKSPAKSQKSTLDPL